MEIKNQSWLPHLENAVPREGQGKRISTYTVALEGWRRGLKLEFYGIIESGYKLKVKYSLSSKEKTHHFSLSMGDKVSDKAFKICDDKDLTKTYLEKGNVPIPKGKAFNKNDSVDNMLAYALNLGFPVVAKPTDGNAGKGVFANIPDIETLEKVLHHLKNDLNYENIIIERFVEGKEYRVFVIEDKVIGAIHRRPANIIGNGINTIRELIHEKNSERKLNPHLTSRLIKIDTEVERMVGLKGYNLNDIPKNDEVIYLREKSNLSAGGEAIDVTDKLTPVLKDISIRVGNAIPDLPHYGIDMIVNKEHTQGTVLEVNTRPGFGGHLFPGEGKARDLASEVIDYYFPETKNIERSNLYFDFDNILEPVKNRAAKKVIVNQVPLGKQYGRKYVLKTNINKKDLRSKIRKFALKNKMHGYTEFIDDRLIIVLSGVDKVKLFQFKDFMYSEYSKEKLNFLQENDWNKPVMYGFENKREYKLTNSEIKYNLKEKERLEKEVESINKKYTKVINSRSWKITYPIRVLTYPIKSIFRK